MKNLMIVLLISISMGVQAQDVISDNPASYSQFKYAQENKVAKVFSRISYAAGGVLIVVGTGKAISNGLDNAFTSSTNSTGPGLGTVALGLAAGVGNCSSCTNNSSKSSRQTPYKEPKPTTKYFVSGGLLIVFGAILNSVEIRHKGNAIERHNSRKLYKFLKAGSTPNGVGLTYNF